jgi:hypothetical protein
LASATPLPRHVRHSTFCWHTHVAAKQAKPIWSYHMPHMSLICHPSVS